MKRILLPILALAATLVLAACGSDSSLPDKAYKIGQGYALAQEGAIGYMEVAKPSSEITGKIRAANDKAAPMVKQALECAKEYVAAAQSPAVPAEAAALGLDAEDVLEAKEAACDGLLSRALKAVQMLDDAVDNS